MTGRGRRVAVFERGGSIGSLGSKGSKESSAAIRQTAQYGAFSDVKGEVSHHTPEGGFIPDEYYTKMEDAFRGPAAACGGWENAAGIWYNIRPV